MSSLLTKKIRSPEKAAILKIQSGSHKGKQFRLLGLKISMGQSQECDIILKGNAACSAQHAVITYEHNDVYKIQSLDPSNPVVVNKKPVQQHILKSKDVIHVGTAEFLFLDHGALPTAHNSSEYQQHQQQASVLKDKQKKNKTRLIFASFMILFVGYVLLGQESKNQQTKKGLKTQQEIMEEIEALKEISDKEIAEKTLTPQQSAARVAFIKGFRDYRKGYFHRSLKFFEQCTTIEKNNSLCRSYINKASVQLEKLIQRKLILGKSYRKNKMYEACKATFKSVEIMVQDSQSPLYKEALENRRLCQAKLENKF